VCPLPLGSGAGDTLAYRRGGGGGVPIRTREQTLWYSTCRYACTGTVPICQPNITRETLGVKNLNVSTGNFNFLNGTDASFWGAAG
jgi:hypothetical protein